MDNENGAWIFVSHSLKDWNKVREIRNQLELKGHKPLLFFLKCLNDNSEVDDLIKREIAARNWFILCDSVNAKESKWVQTEIDFIRSLPDKVYQVIDLDDDLDSQIEGIKTLSKRITIFLSYAHKDFKQAQAISVQLEQNDYTVFLDYQSLDTSIPWAEQLRAAINETIEEGFFLMLISDHTINSQFSLNEIEYALDKHKLGNYGNNIIPIFLTDPFSTINSMPQNLTNLFSNIQYFDFSKGDFNQNIKSLITILKSIKME